MTWPFGDLRMFGYRVLLLDPPWDFNGGGDRNARNHYPCMSVDEIAALPVGQLAAQDAAVFMWITDPFLMQAERVLNAWGFRYVSVAFHWAKLNKASDGYFMGTGYGTRANVETCILGMCGDIGLPKARNVRRLIVDRLREHSRKPERVHGDIERLYDGPYLELFARSRRAGWDSWGNEVGKFEVAA